MRRILTVTSLVALALLVVAAVPGVADAVKDPAKERSVTLTATATGNCTLSGRLTWSNWGGWGVYTEWYNVTDGMQSPVPGSAKTFWFARRATQGTIYAETMTDMPPGTYRLYGYLVKPNGRPVKDSSTWSADCVCSSPSDGF